MWISNLSKSILFAWSLFIQNQVLATQTVENTINWIKNDVSNQIDVPSEIYKKYDSLEKLNNLSVKEIEEMIKTIGMYKTKAKNFKGIVSSLLELGYFPSDRNILESLPGVGRKTTKSTEWRTYRYAVSYWRKEENRKSG